MSTPTRILVVEDEGVVAKDLQMRLRKLGYDVPTTVQTGEEAVELPRKMRPELILMDVRLKGEMDGVETSAQIMEEFRTPVIFSRPMPTMAHWGAPSSPSPTASS